MARERKDPVIGELGKLAAEVRAALARNRRGLEAGVDHSDQPFKERGDAYPYWLGDARAELEIVASQLELLAVRVGR